VQTVHFVIYAAAAAPEQGTRLGVTVSRRVGGAVVRNRLKRRVRECFRLVLRKELPTGTSLVVIARTGAGELTSSAVGEEVSTAVSAASRRLTNQPRMAARP